MGITEWLHWGTFVVALIGGAVGFLSAWTAFFIKYSNLQSTVKTLKGAVDEMKQDLIPKSTIVTIPVLEAHCERHQEQCTKSICRKLKVVEDDVKELKVSSGEEHKALIRIEHFMGKIEGMFLTGKLSLGEGKK